MKLLGLALVFVALPVLAGVGFPVRFEENRGQWPSHVLFEGRNGPIGLVKLTREGVVLGDRIKLQFKDSNAHMQALGGAQTAGLSAYFVGSKKKWAQGVRHFSNVTYKDVYPGIDVTFYVRDSSLEYDFIVQPGANPNLIRMQIDGHQKIKMEPNGDLILSQKSQQSAEIRLRKPISFQRESNMTLKDGVKSSFKILSKNLVAFNVGNFDASKELVIDPAANFHGGGYLHGSSNEIPLSVDYVAHSHNMIKGAVAGYSQSTNFYTKTSGSVYTGTSAAGTADGFVTLFSNSSGADFGLALYSIYIGGASTDVVSSVKLGTDSNGSVNAIYLGGYTGSSDFPWTSGSSNGTDGFVMKLSRNSDTSFTLTYAVVIQGTSSSSEIVNQIALNSTTTGCTTAGSPCVGVVGTTTTTDSQGNAFFVQLNSSGSTSSPGITMKEFGKSDGSRDLGRGIVFDSLGNAVIAGETRSSNLNAWDGSGRKTTTSAALVGTQNVFLARLSSAGTLPDNANTSTNWAVLMTASGSGIQTFGGLSAASDLFYVSGTTNTTLSSFIGSPIGGLDIFVWKTTSQGAHSYGKYFGGTGDDIQLGNQSLVVDATASTSEVVYFTGLTSPSGFITTTNHVAGSGNFAGFGSCVSGGTNAFVARQRLEAADVTNDYVGCFGSSATTTKTFGLVAGAAKVAARDFGTAIVGYAIGSGDTHTTGNNSTIVHVAIVGGTQSYINSSDTETGGFPFGAPHDNGIFIGSHTPNTVDGFVVSLGLCSSTSVCHKPGSFGYNNSGTVLKDYGSGNPDYYWDLALAANGKIVAVGFRYNSAINRNEGLVVRFNPDGSLDHTFALPGGSGIQTVDKAGTGTIGTVYYDVAIDSQGRIVAAGYYYDGSKNIALTTRFSSNGSIDTSYGTSGHATNSAGTNDVFRSVAIGSSDSVIAGGYSYQSAGSRNYVAIVKYNSSGASPITKYDPGGVSPALWYDIKLLSDDRVVAVGAHEASTYQVIVARYKSDLTGFDTFFHSGAILTASGTDLGGSGNDIGYELVLDGSDNVYIGAHIIDGSNYQGIIKVTSSGAMDTSFGGGDGIVRINPLGVGSAGWSITLQKDGKPLVCGDTVSGANGYFTCSQYTTSGTLETSNWGSPNGYTTFQCTSGYEKALGVALQSDGKIVAVGYSNNSVNSCIMRMNSNGTLNN